jgi:hypothetical protein
MAERKPAKMGTQKAAKSTTALNKTSKGFTSSPSERSSKAPQMRVLHKV